MSKGVIIFIRNPELGKVKTRLAKDVGDQRALLIYKELLRHTLEVVQHGDHHNYLFYHERIAQSDEWSAEQFDKRIQPSGDLGGKMKESFRVAFEHSSPCLIIGSDCPRLEARHISQAFDLLNDHDVVLGPTYDGGYYLLGMKVLYPSLFEDIAWSTDQVLTQTIRQVTLLGLSHTLLDTLSDVDYATDWERWGWEI